MKAMSLFANVGIAEIYYPTIGIETVVANEIDPERARFYHYMNRKARVVRGDIRKPKIKERLISLAKERGVELITATPPCQAMSTEGARNPNSDLNRLVMDAVEVILAVRPKYVMFENVPQMPRTKIDVDGEPTMICDFLQKSMGDQYRFNLGPISRRNLIPRRIQDAAWYGVPQSRRRCIILATRNDLKETWEFPELDKTNLTTLEDAIGWLPSLDPWIRHTMAETDVTAAHFPEHEARRIAGAAIHPFHAPPTQCLEHVEAFERVPTGRSVFDDPSTIPLSTVGDRAGEPVRGRRNSYRRQDWDRPAWVLTMNQNLNGSSNCHPGRWLGGDTWSDPRMMTLLEVMIESSIPADWAPPPWCTEKQIRGYIGEGIPPLMTRKICETIPELRRR